MASTPEPGLPNPANTRDARRANWLATGSLIGAGLASACCIVPLLLVSVGISGAWISNLTELEPYKPYVGAVTLALIGYGFWHVCFKPKPPCEDGSYCARPRSARTTKTARASYDPNRINAAAIAAASTNAGYPARTI